MGMAIFGSARRKDGKFRIAKRITAILSGPSSLASIDSKVRESNLPIRLPGNP